MADRPNIVLIFADELRADALGCYGSTVCRTPNLDRLAAESALLSQCMVTQPTCTPSRASVLTGCFPSALRSRMVGCHTPDDPRFLPRVLGRAGYHTASIGKIHMVPGAAEPEAVTETSQADGDFDYYGFRHVDLVNGHGLGGSEYSRWLDETCPDHKERRAAAKPIAPGINNETGSLRTLSWTLPPEAHSGEYITARAQEFFERAAAAPDAPFFLHLSFPDPHHPFTAPEPYGSLYEPERMPPPLPAVTSEAGATALQLATHSGERTRFPDGRSADRVIGTPPQDYSRLTTADWQAAKAIYYGMISLLDVQVGRLLQSLADTGLAENTVVVFLSDHGEYMGDHGLCGKGFHYDSVIRTPMLIRGPGVQAGLRLDSLASTVDLAPTLLALAGVVAPEAMQGISMAPALAGQGPLPRDAALTENDDDFVPMRMRTLTTEEWKLTWYCGEEEGELYDRHGDPDELTNRWRDPACRSVRDALMHRLLEHVVCALDPSNGRTQIPAPPLATFTPRSWAPIDRRAENGGSSGNGR